MTDSVSSADIDKQIARRRTFAIISHPDAGKTTLTEKFLLFGGAIQMAGAVKARKESKAAHSDWMAIEQQRGISVSTSVMTFEWQDVVFNLLDTPGHQDFSEDTYRTLTAVDAAIMVLDVAKGIEEQTRKLFEVCRLRDIPIITFINKLDREGLEPLELLDHIESELALDVVPLVWPIGMGQRFFGCYDLRRDNIAHFDASNKDGKLPEIITIDSIHDAKLAAMVNDEVLEVCKEELELVKGAYDEYAGGHSGDNGFDQESFLPDFRSGHKTPVLFGSALNNFGVKEILDVVAEFAPPPQARAAESKGNKVAVEANDPEFSAFVFKIQANMDKKHRDRIAFARICSGRYERGMKTKHVRSGKALTLSNPMMFFAQLRQTAEIAYAGDIIGIPGHGNLVIGDSLTEKSDWKFEGVPAFAPEMFRRVRLDDPMKAKHLQKALVQLAEEGASQLLRQMIGGNPIIGVVGSLQFDVIAERLLNEYNINAGFDAVPYVAARWVFGNQAQIDALCERYKSDIAVDHLDNIVFLAPNNWHLDRVKQDFEELEFKSIRS